MNAISPEKRLETLERQQERRRQEREEAADRVERARQRRQRAADRDAAEAERRAQRQLAAVREAEEARRKDAEASRPLEVTELETLTLPQLKFFVRRGFPFVPGSWSVDPLQRGAHDKDELIRGLMSGRIKELEPKRARQLFEEAKAKQA